MLTSLYLSFQFVINISMLECDVCICERVENRCWYKLLKFRVSELGNSARMSDHVECLYTLKFESRFTLVLNAVKSTDYIAK